MSSTLQTDVCNYLLANKNEFWSRWKSFDPGFTNVCKGLNGTEKQYYACVCREMMGFFKDVYMLMFAELGYPVDESKPLFTEDMSEFIQKTAFDYTMAEKRVLTKDQMKGVVAEYARCEKGMQVENKKYMPCDAMARLEKQTNYFDIKDFADAFFPSHS